MHLNGFSNLYLRASSFVQGQLVLQDTKVIDTLGFEWDDTPTHEHLVWHNCFGDFKCARLQVPMDWLGTSTEANKTVELALVKVEATVAVTDPTYGGAVILNPGGPGGSGIGQVLRGGHDVRTMLSAGPEADFRTAKHFDVIGFDPRGVNNSRPLLTCFPNQLDEAAWNIEENAHGLMDASDISFDNLWATKRALAEGCSKRAAEEGIAKHMSTAPVARDIIEIFERHGEWREAEAKRLLSAFVSSTEENEVIERTEYTQGREMVQYWGFSYGSILGATLSAMYPSRIKRAVLDGVADSHDYMAGGWSTNLRDTDLLFAKLAEYCYEAGPDQCAIYDKDGPAFISANVQDAVAKLRHNPISVPGNGTRGPQVVTLNDLKLHFRDIVYMPLLEFPRTAQILLELSEGKGTTLAAWKKDHQPKLGEPLSEKCLENGPFSAACFSGGHLWDATYGIACSDGLSRLDQTKEEYKRYADKITAQSNLIGASWASIQLPCTAWHARPHWRYGENFRNKTAHPILFAGNTIDPVTPLYNAMLMASGFDGAGVLHQDSEGHCTYASPSICSGKAIREYFQSGTLPGKPGELKDLDGWEGIGALCEPDLLPFADGYQRGSRGMPDLPKGETDQGLWEALVGLNRAWP